MAKQNRLMLRGILLCLFLSFLISCGGCSLFSAVGEAPKRIRILSYNVQNLFDDVYDGTEYRDYIPSSDGWNSDLFHLKLFNMAEVLSLFPEGGADVLLLQEVENRNAVEMLRALYLKGGGYHYATLSEAAEQAVQTVVLSRFPITKIRVHAVSLGGVSAGRPVLEVHIEIGNSRLLIFHCHWKSKSGGAQDTEPLRIATASLISTLLKEYEQSDPSLPVIVAGDLNERIDEWNMVGGEYPTALMPLSQLSGIEAADRGESLFVCGDFSELCGESGWLVEQEWPVSEEWASGDEWAAILFSPWLEHPELLGSYAYQGQWERIDHFLLSSHFADGSGLEYRNFEVVDDPRLLDEDGFPLRWVPELEQGYSDHLPVLLECEILE